MPHWLADSLLVPGFFPGRYPRILLPTAEAAYRVRIAILEVPLTNSGWDTAGLTYVFLPSSDPSGF